MCSHFTSLLKQLKAMFENDNTVVTRKWAQSFTAAVSAQINDGRMTCGVRVMGWRGVAWGGRSGNSQRN